MSNIVKIELPEITEYDIYMDIDGAAMEDDAVDGGIDSAAPIDDMHNSAEPCLQTPIHISRPGPSQDRATTSSTLRNVLSSTPRMYKYNTGLGKSEESDEAEIIIDIDTPYDGKLRGQTNKFESTADRPKPLTSQFGYPGISKPVSNVAKKSTTQKSTTQKSTSLDLLRRFGASGTMKKVASSNVAKKSTTPKMPIKKSVLSVARKSTTQKRPVSMVSSKQNDTSPGVGLMQGRSDIGSSATTARQTPKWGSTVQSKTATSGSATPSSGSSSKPHAKLKTFTWSIENNEYPMDCPVCSLTMQQRSVRSHLRRIHDLSMKICPKCKLVFTDMNVYSEHYALHLQQEEDVNSGLQSSPFKLGPSKSRSPGIKQPSTSGRMPSSSPRSEVDMVNRLPKFPIQPKLPPKPRRPSMPKHEKSRARNPFGAFSRTNSSSYDEAIQPEPSPPQVRKSIAVRKRPASPATSTKSAQSNSSVLKGSPRERRSSSTSLLSEASFSSEFSEANNISMVRYRDSQKTALRKGVTAISRTYVPPSKKQCLSEEVITLTISRKYCEEAKVSLVPLETASRPYDCKTCLEAFQQALACPKSFRRLTQTDLRTHQETPCLTSPPHQILASDRQGPSLEVGCDSTERNYGRNDRQCHVCKESFLYHSHLLRHIPYHTHPYRCGICKKLFAETHRLRSHYKAVHGNLSQIRMRCKYCDIDFDDVSELERHVGFHKKGMSVACTVCNTEFRNSKEMRTHLVHVHDRTKPETKQSQRCKVCRMSFQQPQQLSEHMQVAHTSIHRKLAQRSNAPIVSKFLSCRICNKVFHHTQGASSHYRLVHGMPMPSDMRKSAVQSKSAACIRFKSKSTVPLVGTGALDNSAGKTTLPEYALGSGKNCLLCGKKYSSSKVLRQHLQHFHGKKSLSRMCKVCGKVFPGNKDFSSHSCTHGHVNNTPFFPQPGNNKPLFPKCHICGRLFNHNKGLSSHLRQIHGVSYPLSAATVALRDKASIPSGSTDASESPTQNNPEVSHLNNIAVPTFAIGKDNKCHDCGNKFSSKRNMLRHWRNVHGAAKSGTVKPENKHTTLNCRICKKTMNTMQGLKTHYRLVHKHSMPVSKVVSKNVSKVVYKDAGRRNCLKCGKVFAQVQTLYRHMRMIHSVKMPESKQTPQSGPPWDCHVCGVSFNARKSMRNHLKLYHPGTFKDERLGSRKCKVCRKSFPNHTKLMHHIVACKLKKKATNPIRGKQNATNLFRVKVNKATMPSRIRGNTNGVYSCPLCDKTFTWKNSVIRHMVSNHNLTREDIDYNMAESFKVAEKTVPQHSIVNRELSLCKICKSCFSDEKSLKRHILRKHDNMSGFFQCRYRSCKKMFTKSQNLLNHIKSLHPGMSPFRCWGCKSGFHSTEELYAHTCFPVTLENVETSQPEESGQSSILLKEQECRYRCTACGMGFHIAREWTKHVQEYHSMATSSDYDHDVDTKVGLNLNIFDIMSAKNSCKCQLCDKEFTDEDTLALHACGRSELTSEQMSAVPGKIFFGQHKKAIKTPPVKCPVCQKYFSPLSMRRHMSNRHSLPLKMCKKCNMVFADVERFKRHCDEHERQQSLIQQAAEQKTDAANLTSAGQLVSYGESSDEGCLTFFVCPSCGGLFNDSDALELHECSARENLNDDFVDMTSTDFQIAIEVDGSSIPDTPMNFLEPQGPSRLSKELYAPHSTVQQTSSGIPEAVPIGDLEPALNSGNVLHAYNQLAESNLSGHVEFSNMYTTDYRDEGNGPGGSIDTDMVIDSKQGLIGLIGAVQSGMEKAEHLQVGLQHGQVMNVHIPQGMAEEMHRNQPDQAAPAQGTSRELDGHGGSLYQELEGQVNLGDVPQMMDTHGSTDDGDVPQMKDTHGTAEGDVPQMMDTHGSTDDGDVPQMKATHGTAEEDVSQMKDTHGITEDGDVPQMKDTPDTTDDADVPHMDTHGTADEGDVPLRKDTHGTIDGDVSQMKDTHGTTDGGDVPQKDTHDTTDEGDVSQMKDTHDTTDGDVPQMMDTPATTDDGDVPQMDTHDTTDDGDVPQKETLVTIDDRNIPQMDTHGTTDDGDVPQDIDDTTDHDVPPKGTHGTTDHGDILQKETHKTTDDGVIPQTGTHGTTDGDVPLKDTHATTGDGDVPQKETLETNDNGDISQMDTHGTTDDGHVPQKDAHETTDDVVPQKGTHSTADGGDIPQSQNDTHGTTDDDVPQKDTHDTTGDDVPQQGTHGITDDRGDAPQMDTHGTTDDGDIPPKDTHGTTDDGDDPQMIDSHDTIEDQWKASQDDTREESLPIGVSNSRDHETHIPGSTESLAPKSSEEKLQPNEIHTDLNTENRGDKAGTFPAGTEETRGIGSVLDENTSKETHKTQEQPTTVDENADEEEDELNLLSLWQ